MLEIEIKRERLKNIFIDVETSCLQLGWMRWCVISIFQKLSILLVFLISNKFIDVKKGSALVHRECTRGQTIKNKNYKNLGNQEKIKMIGSAMWPTNPLKF